MNILNQQQQQVQALPSPDSDKRPLEIEKPVSGIGVHRHTQVQQGLLVSRKSPS